MKLTEDRIRILRKNVTILANASPAEWLEGPGLDRVFHNAEAVPALLDEVERLQGVIDQARARLLESGVCDEFEVCKHPMCDTNWSVYGLLQFGNNPTSQPSQGAREG